MKVHIKLQQSESVNRVFVNGKEIQPESSRLLRDHSPDGFAWGYHGSGPAQLALGICLELFGSHIATCVYQDFKSEFVSGWAPGEFYIDIADFFEEKVVVNIIPALVQWSSQIAWMFSERSMGAVDTFGEVDANMFTALFRINDSQIEWAGLICRTETGFFLKKDTEGWHILAQYPLTHTMSGFLMERALNRTGDALNDFGAALNRAAETAKNLSLQTL